MKIATAQITAKVGDIENNLNNHYGKIELAAQNSVDVIVFPEMSITGYCLEQCKDLAFVENDKRLNKLREWSQKSNIVIIAGAPIKIGDALFIGSFIIKPSGEIDIYTKQFLHGGEEKYYKSSFNYNPIIELKEERITLAICADIDNALHPRKAKENQTTIYIPSIFFTKEGIEGGLETLSSYAKEYSYPILMSNYCGEHFGIVSGGRSAFWNEYGELMSSLGTNKSGLIIAEKNNNQWQTKLFED